MLKMKNIFVKKEKVLQHRQDYITNMVMVQRLCIELINCGISHIIWHRPFDMASFGKVLNIHIHTFDLKKMTLEHFSEFPHDIISTQSY